VERILALLVQKVPRIEVSMKSGRSIVGVLLASSLLMSLPASATERSCVEAFKNAKVNFETRLEKLERQQTMAWGMAAFGVAAGVACGKFLHAGRIGRSACATVFGGGPLVAAYGFDSTSRTKISRLRDAYRLYSIYESRYNPDPALNKEAQAMLSTLGVDKQKEQRALEEFATLMDYGKLCDGEMPRTYEEALGLMRDRLHSAN
jgi:hypothetical protein